MKFEYVCMISIFRPFGREIANTELLSRGFAHETGLVVGSVVLCKIYHWKKKEKQNSNEDVQLNRFNLNCGTSGFYP